MKVGRNALPSSRQLWKQLSGRPAAIVTTRRGSVRRRPYPFCTSLNMLGPPPRGTTDELAA